MRDTVIVNEVGARQALRFKAFRALGLNIVFGIVGLMFCGFSALLIHQLLVTSGFVRYFMIPFVLVFGGMGVLCELIVLYSLFTVRSVSIMDSGLTLKQTFLFLQFKSSVNWPDEIEIKKSSSQGTRIWYDVKIKLQNGKLRLIASQIGNKIEAEWIRKTILDFRPQNAV